MKYREVPNGGEGGPWKIRLFGKFALVDPRERAVELHNQKCEGLVAILALHRPNGVPRELAAEALWPEKPLLKRQESLRQAIAIVRQHTSPDFIFSNRTHCGLSEHYPIECDQELPELRTGSAFMPAQTSPWFEQIRLDSALESDLREETSVMAHCLEFLRWSARVDPKGLYAFFRTNRYLVRGLEPGAVVELLDRAGRPEGICGWADYWRGSVEDDLDLCTPHLKRALSFAIHEPDWELGSEVCFELGKVYARRGDVTRAQRIVRAADEIAERSKQPSALINAARLKGTLLVHWGQMEPGLAILRQSADQIDNPVRRMVAESTQALFEAMSGRYESAARSLEIGEQLGREAGHQQVLLLTTLTRALLTVHGGSRLDALPLLENTARNSYEAGTRQLGVYAEEVSAKVLFLDRDRGAAMTKLGSAKQNRLFAHMVRTPLEHSMVAGVR